VVPLGVDLDHWRPDVPAPDPLPNVPHPRVVFVGRLRHYKGLPVLAARWPAYRMCSSSSSATDRARHYGALQAAGCRSRPPARYGDERLRRIYQTADAAVLT
jgi:hypothetical protein